MSKKERHDMASQDNPLLNEILGIVEQARELERARCISDLYDIRCEFRADHRWVVDSCIEHLEALA